MRKDTRLMDELIDYFDRGGKSMFWICPKGCNDMVTWAKVDGDRYVATCGKCGQHSHPILPR